MFNHPHCSTGREQGRYRWFTSIVALVFFFPSIQLPAIRGVSTDMSESIIIALTNLERTKAGVPTLKPNPLLSIAAQSKAQNMIYAGQFAHYYQSPQGQMDPWQFIINSGYQYLYAGENLGKDFSSAEKLVTAWMNSPLHRDNLLNPNYSEIGVAVIEGPYLDKKDTTLIVQMLASPLPPGAELVTQGRYQANPLISDNHSGLLSNYSGLVWPVLLLVATLALMIFGMVVMMGIIIHPPRTVNRKLWRH